MPGSVAITSTQIYIWSGSGVTNAPTASTGYTIPMGAAGFNGSASTPATDLHYWYDLENDTWRASGATVATFSGA